MEQVYKNVGSSTLPNANHIIIRVIDTIYAMLNITPYSVVRMHYNVLLLSMVFRRASIQQQKQGYT